MEAASRGAKSRRGSTVGLLPGLDRTAANGWVDIAVATGLGELRNGLVVRASDAVIAVGGGHGTLSEIAFALKLGRPVVGLATWDVHGIERLPARRRDPTGRAPSVVASVARPSQSGAENAAAPAPSLAAVPPVSRPHLLLYAVLTLAVVLLGGPGPAGGRRRGPAPASAVVEARRGPAGHPTAGRRRRADAVADSRPGRVQRCSRRWRRHHGGGGRRDPRWRPPRRPAPPRADGGPRARRRCGSAAGRLPAARGRAGAGRGHERRRRAHHGGRAPAEPRCEGRRRPADPDPAARAAHVVRRGARRRRRRGAVRVGTADPRRRGRRRRGPGRADGST
jgi:hypothetical protein